MKEIKISNKLYPKLESCRLLFQAWDRRSYTIPQTIERLLQIARSEGFA